MTQAVELTNGCSFADSIRIFNSELIPMLAGKKVVSAKPSNKLPYRKKDGQEVPKTGLLVELEGEATPIGLFRWDLIPQHIEYVDDKPKSLTLTDTLHKTAREQLKPNISEEQWLQAIADEIKDKVCGDKTFLGKKSSGGYYEGHILTIG